MEKFRCLRRRINAAWGAFGKPGRMIGVGMGEQDRRWCDAPELAKPICAAINHYSGATLLNEQGAMTPMPPGAKLDTSARPEKGHLHFIGRSHLDRRRMCSR